MFFFSEHEKEEQSDLGIFISATMESSLYTIFVCLSVFSSFCLCFASSIDFITSSLFIKDPETLGSSDFKPGFFSPKNSTNRYVGIWHSSESTVMWIANRDQPLRDFSGVVTISEDGNLVVLNGQKQTLWSSSVSDINSNLIAQLLDNGNLVLREKTTEKTLWQSFQDPSDSFVPTMKLGTNPRTVEMAKLTSWKSPSDPSIGSFSASLERLDAPEVFIYNGSKPYWRSGPWNGRVFLGLYQMGSSYLSGFYLGKDQDGTSYITFVLENNSDFAALKLSSNGKWMVTGWWNDRKATGSWIIQNSECEIYGLCGAFGSCNQQSSPVCSCLTGFEPKNPEEWNRQNWSNGCVRKAPLQCERFKNGSEAGAGDGFLKLQMMKVPDFAKRSKVVEDKCRKQCLENCSCLAYAYDANIGCMSWSGNLIDIHKFPSAGVDLYIRLANLELDKKAENSDDTRADQNRNKWKNKNLIIAISVTIGMIILAACLFLLWKSAAKCKGETHRNGQVESIIRDSTTF